jgi:hypothetical protein
MSWKLPLGISASLVFAVADTGADANRSVIAEQPHHVSQGMIDIDAPPAAVYALVTSYASWPSFLSDVTYVHIDGGGRHDGRVTFRSRALRNQKVTLLFDNDPDSKITFRGIKGPPGASAWGSYTLEPIDNGKRTRVIAKLYMDVDGAPALFVRDKTIRKMRQTKLRADLDDVARYFATRHVSER